MYFYLLILLSLGIAGIYDYYTRSINDLVWIPAVIAVLVIPLSFHFLITPLVFRLVIITILGTLLVYRGYIGQADVIAFAFAFSDPFSLSIVGYNFVYFLFIISCVTFINFIYVFIRFKPTTISVSEFMQACQWFPIEVETTGGTILVSHDINSSREEIQDIGDPHARISVVYGHPFATYIAEAFIVYFIYLVIFHLPFLIQTP